MPTETNCDLCVGVQRRRIDRALNFAASTWENARHAKIVTEASGPMQRFRRSDASGDTATGGRQRPWYPAKVVWGSLLANHQLSAPWALGTGFFTAPLGQPIEYVNGVVARTPAARRETLGARTKAAPTASAPGSRSSAKPLPAPRADGDADFRQDSR